MKQGDAFRKQLPLVVTKEMKAAISLTKKENKLENAKRKQRRQTQTA